MIRQPKSQLLALPNELLAHEILALLNLKELLILRETCQTFLNLIDADTLLQYGMELEIAGMVDVPGCSYHEFPIAKRLQTLRERESRWAELRPSWTRTVTFPVYLRASFEPTRKRILLYGPSNHPGTWKNDAPFGADLLSFSLPTEKDEVLEWQEVNLGLGEEIEGFGSASRSYDLIICVTRPPIGPDSENGCSNIYLLQHSTFQPHPMASSPVLTTPTDSPHALTKEWSLVSLDVLEETIILTVSRAYCEVSLYVWNWPTGQFNGVFQLPACGSPSAPIWLFENAETLLWPNERDNCLDIYDLKYGGNPDASASDGNTRPNVDSRVDLVLRLQLPPLKYNYHIDILALMDFCTSAPKDSPYSEMPKPPFAEDPLQAIIFLTAVYPPIDLDDDETDSDDDDGDENRYNIIMGRSLLFQTIHEALKAQHLKSGLFQAGVPWEEWGPTCTRWIRASGESWLSGSGMRAARSVSWKEYQLSQNPRSWFERVEMFDFSSYRLRRLQARQSSGADRTDAEGEDSTSRISFFFRSDPTIISPSSRRSPFAQEVRSTLPYSQRFYDATQPNDFINGPENKEWVCTGVMIDELRIVGIMENLERRLSSDAYNIMSFA